MTILNYLFSKDMIQPFSVMVVPPWNLYTEFDYAIFLGTVMIYSLKKIIFAFAIL